MIYVLIFAFIIPTIFYWVYSAFIYPSGYYSGQSSMLGLGLFTSITIFIGETTNSVFLALLFYNYPILYIIFRELFYKTKRYKKKTVKASSRTEIQRELPITPKKKEVKPDLEFIFNESEGKMIINEKQINS